MPFQQRVLISYWKTPQLENEYVVLNGTDSTGVADSGDRVIGLDASQSEAKPSWLTEERLMGLEITQKKMLSHLMVVGVFNLKHQSQVVMITQTQTQRLSLR